MSSGDKLGALLGTQRTLNVRLENREGVIGYPFRFYGQFASPFAQFSQRPKKNTMGVTFCHRVFVAFPSRVVIGIADDLNPHHLLAEPSKCQGGGSPEKPGDSPRRRETQGGIPHTPHNPLRA